MDGAWNHMYGSFAGIDFIQSLRAFRRAESRGRSLEGVGGTLGVPGPHWGVPGGRWGGPREVPGAPRGGPRRHQKHRRFFQGVLGGSGGSPGVISVVGGGPGDRPGRWKC